MIAGGVAVLAVLAALFVNEKRVSPETSPAGSSDPAPAVAGNPPDLTSMSPRERFDRLYNRVMQASENGDTGTVAQFSPMALAAYGMLDQVDADARYHAAMLRLHTGDPAGAAALADTILAANPAHLLGLIVQGNVARFRQDPNGQARAQAAFLAGFDAEMAAGRGEYQDHKVIIDRFREEAGGKAP